MSSASIRLWWRPAPYATLSGVGSPSIQSGLCRDGDVGRRFEAISLACPIAITSPHHRKTRWLWIARFFFRVWPHSISRVLFEGYREHAHADLRAVCLNRVLDDLEVILPSAGINSISFHPRFLLSFESAWPGDCYADISKSAPHASCVTTDACPSWVWRPNPRRSHALSRATATA